MTTGKYEEVNKLLQKMAADNGKTLPEGTLLKQEINVSFFLITTIIFNNNKAIQLHYLSKIMHITYYSFSFVFF